MCFPLYILDDARCHSTYFTTLHCELHWPSLPTGCDGPTAPSSLGAALARGLGTNPGKVQAATLVAVTLTTGAAVAVAGPIAFVGLIIPPAARRLAGHSLQLELVASAILGAGLLLLADTLGRLVLAPGEVRAGIMVALLGAPVFIFIARSLRPGATA